MQLIAIVLTLGVVLASAQEEGDVELVDLVHPDALMRASIAPCNMPNDAALTKALAESDRFLSYLLAQQRVPPDTLGELMACAALAVPLPPRCFDPSAAREALSERTALLSEAGALPAVLPPIPVSVTRAKPRDCGRWIGRLW